MRHFAKSVGRFNLSDEFSIRERKCYLWLPDAGNEVVNNETDCT